MALGTWCSIQRLSMGTGVKVLVGLMTKSCMFTSCPNFLLVGSAGGLNRRIRMMLYSSENLYNGQGSIIPIRGYMQVGIPFLSSASNSPAWVWKLQKYISGDNTVCFPSEKQMTSWVEWLEPLKANFISLPHFMELSLVRSTDAFQRQMGILYVKGSWRVGVDGVWLLAFAFKILFGGLVSWLLMTEQLI